MTPNEYRRSFKKNLYGSKAPLRSFIPEPTDMDPDRFSAYNDEKRSKDKS